MSDINMKVSDLKKIIANLPDDMPVVIPVIDENDCNRLFGFRYVRTSGILSCEDEEDKTVLCLNAANNQDIADQVHFSGRDCTVEKILYGGSQYEKKSDTDTAYNYM